MQTNNLKTSSCQDDDFTNKHLLVKKIVSKLEKEIGHVYKVADFVKPDYQIIFTFINRAYKGKSFLLNDVFKLLFEESLEFLQEIYKSRHIIDELRIYFYLYK